MVTEAVLVVPLPVAETVTTVSAATVPAEAEKEALVAPAATVMEAGMVRAALLSERVTRRPAAGAAAVRVTVQEAVPPEVTEEGLQERVLGTGRGEMVTEAVLVVPLPVAETVTTVSAATVPAEAEKEALVAPAATVMEAGMVRAALLSERVTSRPAAGAAPVRETVQVDAPLESSDAGEQASWLKVTAGAGDEMDMPLTILDRGIKLPLDDALRPVNWMDGAAAAALATVKVTVATVLSLNGVAF
jgi:hypothetical protein